MVLGQCMEVMRKNQELEKGRKVSLFHLATISSLTSLSISLLSFRSDTVSSRSYSKAPSSETAKLCVPLLPLPAVCTNERYDRQ